MESEPKYTLRSKAKLITKKVYDRTLSFLKLDYNYVFANITWACNLRKCPYCWVRKVIGEKNMVSKYDVPAKKWVKALNKMPRTVFDFVGGEPLIFPNFVYLCNNLAKKHRFSVTTNLHAKKQLLEFLKKVSPERCVCITCSFHPSGRLNKEEFLERVKWVQAKKFKVNINILEHKSIPNVKELKNFFESDGVDTIISPDEDPTLLNRREKHIFTCNAGIKHYFINNNGDVYRCLTAFRHPRKKDFIMGNIFDGTFKPFKKRHYCNLPCEVYYILDPYHNTKNMYNLDVELEDKRGKNRLLKKDI